MTSAVANRHAVSVSEPAEPDVPERATRRVFSAQYKLKILAEYERRRRDGKKRPPPSGGVVHLVDLGMAQAARRGRIAGAGRCTWSTAG
jgi:hypothetical protein